MRDQVNELIQEHKGVLIRSKNHEVWRFPNGKTFVRAKTPSDVRADANNLSDLRKILGIEREQKIPGVRVRTIHRPKPRPAPAPVSAAPPVKRQHTIPLGTFAASIHRRIETTGDKAERETLQEDLDRMLWEQSMKGVKRIR